MEESKGVESTAGSLTTTTTTDPNDKLKNEGLCQDLRGLALYIRYRALRGVMYLYSLFGTVSFIVMVYLIEWYIVSLYLMGHCVVYCTCVPY